MKTKWIQLSRPCKCGSWYAKENEKGIFVCNNKNCLSVKNIEKINFSNFKQKKHIGKKWSKKLHRYITNNDVKKKRI